MNAAGAGIEAVKITPAALAELLALVAAGQINQNGAKRALGVMFETGRPASEIVRELGLAQVSDADVLAGAVSQALAKFPPRSPATGVVRRKSSTGCWAR